MNRLFKLLAVCFLFSSCTNKQKQLANEKNILGDWVTVNNTHGGLQPPLFLMPGYTFYANHTCDYKSGYYRYIPGQVHFYDQNESPGKTIYLGSMSEFKITDDSLKIFNPGTGKWNSFKIIRLSSDSLKLENKDEITVYNHLLPVKYKSMQFDEIIISTSECLGPCPISNTIINSEGAILFNGISFTSQKGLFTCNIPKEQYQRLQDNFCKSNIDSLKTNYTAGFTDGQKITATFVKDGKIYKTITDYGGKGPILFEWATVPVSYLYQSVPLKKINFPFFAQDSTNFISTKLRNGNKILDLKLSESFLLFDYLRNGKSSNTLFKERFNFRVYYYRDADTFYSLSTDGRYYKFIVKGKPVTIDIGFNFYDVNAKNWVWRKADKYD